MEIRSADKRSDDWIWMQRISMLTNVNDKRESKNIKIERKKKQKLTPETNKHTKNKNGIFVMCSIEHLLFGIDTS